MPALSKMKDNQYDLAIVDPPYGIGADKYKWGDKIKKDWDYKPTKEYFEQLIRVSKNQIIWGGNYFDLPPTNSIIIWNKDNGKSFANDGELAWCSNPKIGFRIYKEFWISNMIRPKNMPRIHPTQKSIDLYRWLLKNYAKEGDKILDTHGGSMSIAIACHDLKFDLDLYEIDKDYFEAGVKRFNNHKSQLTIF